MHKLIKNKYPFPFRGMTVEKDSIWKLNVETGFYELRENTECFATEEQANNHDLFEPVEEPFLQEGENFTFINSFLTVQTDNFRAVLLDHQKQLKTKNIFRSTTGLNVNGVHISNAQKVFQLALLIPKLWEWIRWNNGTLITDNPIDHTQKNELYRAVREIEFSSLPRKMK